MDGAATKRIPLNHCRVLVQSRVVNSANLIGGHIKIAEHNRAKFADRLAELRVGIVFASDFTDLRFKLRVDLTT